MFERVIPFTPYSSTNCQFDRGRRIQIVAEPGLHCCLALGEIFRPPLFQDHRYIMSGDDHIAWTGLPERPNCRNRLAADGLVVGSVGLAAQQFGTVFRSVPGEDDVAILALEQIDET